MVHRERSARPSRGAVAHVSGPADRAAVIHDVQGDLKLYAILGALRDGQFPDNKQLDALLGYMAKRCPPRNLHVKLSPDTEELFEAIRDLLITVRLVLREKNADELIQDTMWMTWKESRDVDGSAARHIRTLTMLFVTSPEVRALLTEILVVGRSILKEKRSKERKFVIPVPDKESQPIEDRIPGAYLEEDSDSDDDDSYEHAVDAVDPRLLRLVKLFKKAVSSLQLSDGYLEAMSWLLDTFQYYEREAAENPDNSPFLNSTRELLSRVITIMERFANGRSLSGVQGSILQLYRKFLYDPNFAVLGTDTDAYLRRVLLERGFLQHENCVPQAEELWDRWNQWFADELNRAQWNVFFVAVSTWLGVKEDDPDPEVWFPDDPVTSRLETDSRRVGALLLGKKRVVWSDICRLIFPSVCGWGYVTIPRFEVCSPKIELVLENIHLSLANVIPTLTTYKSQDIFKFTPFDELDDYCASKNRKRVQLRLDQIQADARDLLASVRVKRFSLFEQGKADITLSRNGIVVEIDVEINFDPGAQRVLEIHEAKVTVDEMRIVARGTGRDYLFRLFLPIAMPFLKNLISTKLTKKLNQLLERINREAVIIRDRTQAEDADVKGAAIRVMSRRWDEVKKESLAYKEYKATVEESIRAGKETPTEEQRKWRPILKSAKFSSRIEDALRPDVSAYPEESLLYRRAKEEKLAREAGDKEPTWRSPVFSFAWAKVPTGRRNRNGPSVVEQSRTPTRQLEPSRSSTQHLEQSGTSTPQLDQSRISTQQQL